MLFFTIQLLRDYKLTVVETWHVGAILWEEEDAHIFNPFKSSDVI